MLSYLAELEEWFGPFRLFRYLSLRSVLAAGTALLLGFALAPWLLRKLRAFNVSQIMRESSEVGELAALHAGKEGTPTMGGFLIFGSIVISSFLWARPNIYVLTALFAYTALTIIGFVDDYYKITRKSSGGLSSRAKLFWQMLVTFAVLAALLLNSQSNLIMAQLWVPFVKDPLIQTMPLWFLAIFLFLILAGSSNAINLTDGIDGLAIGCTVTVALVYGIMAYAAGHVIISDYLLISNVPGSGELAVICAAMVGASLSFLWYNAYPAEVFMGDTGSLALGGLIGIIAFMIHQPLTLIIVGGIFVMEALSVIIQVVSYKTRRKRVFLMAPIHHHFELKGWAEAKVVIRFWILSLIFAISGLATLKLR